MQKITATKSKFFFILFFICFILQSHSSFAMQIFIKLPSSVYITLEVEPTDKIEDLKLQIQEKKDILVEEQELSFAGKKLEDGKTLQDYSIQKDSTLLLTLKLPTTCGDFVVRGGSIDIDYEFIEPKLHILSSTPLSISSTRTTTDRIVVNTGVTANITLYGIDIDVSSIPNGEACAFELVGDALCNIVLKSENVLKSGYRKAGLEVQKKDGKKGTLIIEGTGSLSANGQSAVVPCGRECFEYYASAGIGGANGESSGKIIINSGTITAQGGGGDRAGSLYGAAGIGGGRLHQADTIIINGGEINSTGGHGGAGIGNGFLGRGGVIIINGGSIVAKGGPGGFFGGGGFGIGGDNEQGTTIINGGSITAIQGSSGIGIGNKSFFTGNAFVIASSISDQSNKEGWSGIIFENDRESGNGKIYGSSVSLSTKVIIPIGRKLIVEKGQTLNSGNMLSNEGTILNCGIISGDINGNQPISGGVISFDINKGSGMPPAPSSCGISAIMPNDNGFSYANHIFLLWNTNADGSGKDYAVGEEIFYTGDTTLFAKWKLDTCELRINGLSVLNGTTTTDYSYNRPVLKILSSAPISLSGTTNRDYIEVADNITANITLEGVNIRFDDGERKNNTSDERFGGTIALKLGSTTTLNLILKESSKNKLKSGENRPGIYVPSDAILNISGSGSLSATGGWSGAGIGSGLWNNAGTINISSGFVAAFGGKDAAGIGGGHSNDAMDNQFGGFVAINIGGGTVLAQADGNAAGIGTGCWSKCATGKINIENSAVFANTNGYHSSCAAIGRGIIPEGSNNTIEIAISNSVVSAKNYIGFSITGVPDISTSIVNTAFGDKFYGNTTLASLYVPAGQLLVVEKESVLTVSGRFINDGTIKKCGIINGNIENNPPISGVTVAFNINGAVGNTPPPSSCLESGDYVPLQNNNYGFSKEGFTFAGWNTAADCSGTLYQSYYYADTGNIELFAAWIEGNGTEENPYLLYTPSDIIWLSSFTISGYGNHATQGKFFKMMNDIDMQDIKDFISIGNTWIPFAGNFDGNGKKITNLTITERYDNEIGLFGNVNEYGSIKNVGIENANIECLYANRIGALVAYSKGANIKNCYAKKYNIKGAGHSYIGGLIGWLEEGEIENCYVICDTISQIEGSERGLVGGLIAESYKNTIKNSYAVLKNIINSTAEYKGLFIANCEETILSNNFCLDTIENFGSAIGNATDINIIEKSNEEFQDCMLNTTLNNSGENWIYNPMLNNGYPALAWEGNDTATFVVKFDTKGSTAIEDIRCVITGSKITEPIEPIKLGNKFLAWYTDETFTTIFDFANDIIIQDTTLFAGWKPDTIKNEMYYDSACAYSNFVWRNKNYTNTGIYYDTVAMPIQIADTIYGLNLFVFPQAEFVEITLDSNQRVSFKDSIYISSQMIFDTVKYSFGCDSLITKVNIIVRKGTKPEIIVKDLENASICEGEEYIWRNKILTLAGTYTDTLKIDNAQQADTIFSLHLDVQFSNMVGIKYKRILYVNNSERLLKKEFQWYFNGEEIIGARKQYYDTEGRLNGTYQVKLNYLDGTQTMTCPIQFENVKPMAIVVPNPVSMARRSEIIIKNTDLMDLQNMSVKIFSLQGTLVYETIISGDKIPIPRKLKTGQYIVKVIDQNREILQTKFVVVK